MPPVVHVLNCGIRRVPEYFRTIDLTGSPAHTAHVFLRRGVAGPLRDLESHSGLSLGKGNLRIGAAVNILKVILRNNSSSQPQSIVSFDQELLFALQIGKTECNYEKVGFSSLFPTSPSTPPPKKQGFSV